MELTHMQQPKGSRLCGQTVVAIYCGVTLEDSIKVFGKKSSTRTKEVIKALEYYGHKTATTKLKRLGSYIPKVAILKVVRNTEGSHWVLKVGNYIYDPSYERPCPYFHQYQQFISAHGKITSYLEIVR